MSSDSWRLPQSARECLASRKCASGSQPTSLYSASQCFLVFIKAFKFTRALLTSSTSVGGCHGAVIVCTRTGLMLGGQYTYDLTQIILICAKLLTPVRIASQGEKATRIGYSGCVTMDCQEVAGMTMLCLSTPEIHAPNTCQKRTNVVLSPTTKTSPVA